MALFGRRSKPSPAARPPAPPASRRATPPPARPTSGGDWSDVESVRREWPREDLDEQRDLRLWQEGVALYDNDDYDSMVRSATLQSAALAHSLHGEGILHDDDLPATVYRVLYSSLEPPPDGQTFTEGAQRAARLALTLVRENGWQPAHVGGGWGDPAAAELIGPLILDSDNHGLLSAAIAPPGRPAGNLKAFLAVAPKEGRRAPSNPQSKRADALANPTPDTTRRAQGRDAPAAEHYFDTALSAHGDGNWADIESVRREWPREDLDEQRDLRLWREGVALYERDDYGSMMRSGTLQSAALAHSLYGDGILHGADLPNTVHRVLYSSLEPPPDGRTFADSAQRAARLALTIMRENGWQPAEMGGRGDPNAAQLFDPLVLDTGNLMLLGAAVAPADRLWEGDLKAFFAVPPTETARSLPDPEVERGKAVVHLTYDTMQRAQAGEDAAARHHFEGMGLWANGRPEEALTALSEAARLGSVQAMQDAGDLSRELGRAEEATFWYESAAAAGNAAGMYNLGAMAVQANNPDTAAVWFQRSAEAGVPEGYAALTQLAEDRGDAAGERHWARLGAEAGQTFCMYRHGLYLVTDAKSGDVPQLRRARDFLEQAAGRGDVDAMLTAGAVNGQLGDDVRASRFFAQARATGDPQALAMLEKYGV